MLKSRGLSILLCFVLCISLVNSVNISASAINKTEKEENNITTVKKCESVKDYVVFVKNEMLACKSLIEVVMDELVWEQIQAKGTTYKGALAYSNGLGLAFLDDVADDYRDGAYLVANIRSVTSEYIRSSVILGDVESDATISLKYNLAYYATKEEEDYVDKQIPKVLKKIGVLNKNMTESKKIKKIHDYIANLIRYDNSLKYNTVYSALKNKTGVCKSYALLAYRLYNEAGIPCEYVTGETDKAYHAWNLVKYKGKWYNMDITWDDPVTSTGEQITGYSWFLCNNKDFKGHYRDEIYSTKEYIAAHPMSKKSFKITWD